MCEEKIYELRTDVWTPAAFWKAGTRATEKEWIDAFGDFHIKWASEWFIDLSIQEEPHQKDALRELIDKVFKRKRLHSMTYKDAAQEVAELWLKRNQSK
jgi:uncharacterized protein YpiB (UPF0302 family)